MPDQSRARGGGAFLLAAIFSFASVPLFLKYFTGILDAWTVNGVRYGVAAVFWLPLVLATHSKTEAGRNVWRAALLPALVNTAAQIGWALAPYHNDAGFIGFTIRSSFLFSTVFGFWLLPGERATVRRPAFWLGAAAIGVGIVAMYRAGLDRGGTSPLGLLILVCTAVGWGVYGVLVRRCMSGFGVRLSFGVVSLYTAVALGVLMLIVGDWGRLADVAARDWSLLIVSALVGIALSHVLLYRAIHGLGPVLTEGGMAVQPFMTALGAAVLLRERLSAGQWVGGAILAAGCLVLVSLKRNAGRDGM